MCVESTPKVKETLQLQRLTKAESTSHDAPQFGVYNSFEELKRIREAAPSCFMQSGGAVSVASEYEAMKLSHKYLEIGADCVYGGTWSYKWIKALRDENIPINSHK